MNTAEQLTNLYREDSATDREGHFYKGIREYANAGSLAYVAAIVSQNVPIGSKVLDIASGQGALALRLKDAGFDVHACDYVAENFKAGVPFTQLDLNEPFAGKLPTFDCIVACAIIEHLENPRHFLRELRKALRPGGTLIVTTPNTDSPVSKATYLAFGHFSWFSENDYKTVGHITPVSPGMLALMANELGFKAELSTYGDQWKELRSWPRMWLYAKAASLLDRGQYKGETLIGVMTQENIK